MTPIPKPKTFRMSNIVVEVWKEQTIMNGTPTEIFLTNCYRQFKDTEGKTQSTQTFRPHDIPKLQVVLTEAYKYIAMME